MSMSPHQIFGRLHELKKWQQTHEKLLKRSSFDEKFDETSPSLSNSHHNSGNQTHPDNEVINQDYVTIPPGKNFEQLLQEKLDEYVENVDPYEGSNKPKKPFLRKGSGLLKYKLKPDEYKKLIGNKVSNTTLPYRKRPKSVELTQKPIQNLSERPQTSGSQKKSSISNRNTSTRPQTASSVNSVKKTCIKSQDNKLNANLARPVSAEVHSKNKKTVQIQTHQSKNEFPNRPKTVGDEPSKKSSPTLHDFIEKLSQKSTEYTPLKAPEIRIKPRGNWCDIDTPRSENDEIFLENSFSDKMLETGPDMYNDKSYPVRSQWRNGIVRQINEFTNTMGDFVDDNSPRYNCKEMEPSHIDVGVSKNSSFESTNQSLYEKALETELLIFEALEKRAEQSGFSSTNTSIIQLLASTPSKFNLKNNEINTVNSIFEKNNEMNENQSVGNRSISTFNVKKPIDDNHLRNLRQTQFSPRLEFCPDNPQIDELEEESENYEEPDEETDDEEDIESHGNMRDSSINTETLETFDDNFSSASSVVSGKRSLEESTKVSIRDNCSSPDNLRTDMTDSCPSCSLLIKNKIEECQIELENLKMEKERIVTIRQQMAREKKEFEKEMKLRRKQFEEQRLKFQKELEDEKKKIAERSIVEKSNKDPKLKTQHKKDREEINNLKIELNETKELMKLRETKNATCIARLRSQMKLLEKKNAELKSENERLLKEKSRLTVQQKTLNKSTETKMLKEISRNLSKLTEETFKNQHFRTDTSSEDDSRRTTVRGSSRGDSEGNSKKSSKNLHVTGLIKDVTLSCHGHGEGLIEEFQTHAPCLIEENNIEEKYKSLFGGNDAIIEEVAVKELSPVLQKTRTTGLGKVERILEDGTKEIKYSNGNVKLVSENGTTRYYYSSNDTWHTNFADGTEVIEFPNGQSEKRFKDGKCLVFFPDGLIQTIFPDGTEEVKYPDGSKLLTKKNGERMLFLSNGQVEIHTKDHKRREYPDGTVKILYPDGSQETRYFNGRIRMKNSRGEIVLDTGEPNV